MLCSFNPNYEMGMIIPAYIASVGANMYTSFRLLEEDFAGKCIQRANFTDHNFPLIKGLDEVPSTVIPQWSGQL